MRAVIQRVSKASVTIKNELYSNINNGLLVLLAVNQEDSEDQIAWLVEKIVNLRVFSDDNGKMNLSLLDTNGELLIVSQFTLYGDCRRGRRPSYSYAAKPDIANDLYEKFIAKAKEHVATVKNGVFGANMQIDLINDGPVTLIIDSL